MERWCCVVLRTSQAKASLELRVELYSIVYGNTNVLTCIDVPGITKISKKARLQ
jgi:hypothetical protein